MMNDKLNIQIGIYTVYSQFSRVMVRRGMHG